MKNGTAMPIRVSARPIHLGTPDFESLGLIESDDKSLGPAVCPSSPGCLDVVHAATEDVTEDPQGSVIHVWELGHDLRSDVLYTTHGYQHRQPTLGKLVTRPNTSVTLGSHRVEPPPLLPPLIVN
jgi:hypothetical protein